MKVISVIGYKNTGKTTLVTRLVQELSKLGRVGTAKMMLDHRLDDPKTDTGKHFDAGADMVTAVTNSELVSIQRDPSIEKAIDALADAGMDFAVVEGAKDSTIAKILLGDIDEDVQNVVARLPARSEWNLGELVDVIREQPDHVTLDLLLKQIKETPGIEKVGGIGSFTGIVRVDNEDFRTSQLEFESYKTAADTSIQKIREEIMQQEGIIDVLIHHKVGTIKPLEDIVYIVVAAGHRQQLFPALAETLERVKSEVPIWKKEITVDGNFWVHDHA
ncbi:molybdopterin-guanine dinucleotide biosynthesis protein MobB [Methanococcoides methylutens]|uniref:Molybdopterin-guanine dinucleotide biosynthesis protein MobB n=1 Tax=Methanococcoides methylutens TaxID=2226 RepID=A0A099T0C7_METMT|nr:molybdopterin synthase [Methanococcoides methylutens]KGK98602.1 molybdopterin-guanine dinucleotide biosynthesis protein MobB [Methanococcoides methylutens]